MSNDTGGLAFQNFSHDCNDCPELAKGMTLLDYYAGQALATMVESWAGSDSKYAGDVARKCYSFADAMITEKNRREAESD